MKIIRPVFIISIIVLLFVQCKWLFNQNETKKYEVYEIDGYSIQDYKELGARIFPEKISLTNDDDFNFQGTVKFDSIGIKLIRNYNSDTSLKRQFFVDTQTTLGPVENIMFWKLEITASSMNGEFLFVGPLINAVSVPFKTIQK